MDAKTFFQNVVEMRKNQLIYEKTGSIKYKAQSKYFEHIIDKEIERVGKFRDAVEKSKQGVIYFHDI